MTRRSERWLAEQEAAVLEAVYELQSPPEPEDWRQWIMLEPDAVRALSSRLRSASSQPNRTTRG
jgi:hypothetical protein